MITLRRLPDALTVCQVASMGNFDSDFYFAGRTEEELSLVCRTAETPENTLRREDGWRGFRVVGSMEFGLVGILAGISGALAAAGIALFAVSTFNTDYVLVKEPDFDRAGRALAAAGYEVLP